jgi:hypothetical protein
MVSKNGGSRTRAQGVISSKKNLKMQLLCLFLSVFFLNNVIIIFTELLDFVIRERNYFNFTGL